MQSPYNRYAWLNAKRVHFTLLIVWLILAFPAVLLWRNSVPFLVFISIYAVAISHWSAYEGAKAEMAANSDTTTPAE